ncbi:MAG: hypothetical protein LW730_08395 [Xanthomonadaceae bacterium]|jgi:hypothetical protein|nr:hypothetical protein [Xanthomonadaceae bacterium]
MVHELFKLQDTTAASRFSEQIAQELGGINQGLYLFLFENSHENHIFDSNTKPKIVVPKKSAAIKPGKFENTFRNRFYGYEKDMKFNISNEIAGEAFLQSFCHGYVLDLPKSTSSLSTARIFERYWIEEIFHFLENEGALSLIQNKRAEWRMINYGTFTPMFNEKILAHLNRIAGNILNMKTVIS